MGLSQSFPPIRGGKTQQKTGFHFNVQKRLLPESGGLFLAKRPCLEGRTEAGPKGRKSTVGSVSASSHDSRKKGSFWDGIPDVLQSTMSSASSSAVQVGTLPQF